MDQNTRIKNPKIETPYSQYQNTEEWVIIARLLKELEDNQDIELKTAPEYVIANSELEKYKEFIQNQPNYSLSLSDLQKDNSNSQNSTKNPDNKLVIGLALGAGAVALVSVAFYLWNRKKKSNH